MAGNLNELWKKGSVVPLSGDLVEGGLGIDVVGKQAYSKSNGGDIFRIGINAIADIEGLQTSLNGKEPILGTPSSNGYVLVSTTGDVRSWVEISSISPVQSVNGKTDVVVLDTGDIASIIGARYVTDADLVKLGNLSGTNTGDQDLSPYALLVGATFTGQVKGITPVDVADLTRKDYVDGKVSAITFPVTSVNIKTGAVVLDTGDVAENGNLYFTDVRGDARVQAAINDSASASNTLYSSSKIESLIEGGLTYKGIWNAATNTPTLSDATGTSGDLYKCTVDGTQDLGSGSIDWEAGDSAVHNGTIYEQVKGTPDTVTSVNSKIGDVVLTTDDISEGATHEYYTDAKVDARLSGVIDDNTTVLDYTWSSNKINSSITSAVSAIDYPVDSVNGYTNTVVLAHTDVGAAASIHTHATNDITGLDTALGTKLEQSDLDAALTIGTY